MSNIVMQQLTVDDREWVARFMAEHWGSSSMVVHGTIYYPHEFPGFVALCDGERVGLVTYRLEGNECEMLSLDSMRQSMGVGSALIEAVKEAARRAGCWRLWLITTNDNLHALRFYQKRGFTLVAVYPNALEAARKLKPEIPLIGYDGIPLRDEIELETILPQERN
jgi:GNAT superfamily N-acetyltransferase